MELTAKSNKKGNRKCPKYDIIVFGASGFTGQFCVVEILQTLSTLPLDKQFTWAVAGRSAKSLENVLKQSAVETGLKISQDVGLLLANVEDEASIIEMVKSCKILLNCVGPYALYGERVVSACVQNSTHHLDISIEAQFFYEMYLKYHDLAEANGSFIVAACGYGCIPQDFGSIYLDKQFEGVLNNLEIVASIGQDVSILDIKIHYGTYHSILLLAHDLLQVISMRRKILDKFKPPYQFEHKQGNKILRYDEKDRKWGVMVPLPISPYMEFTQRIESQKDRIPFQNQIFFNLPNIFWAFLLLIGQFLLPFLLYFKPVLNLLLKYSKFFTGGRIHKDTLNRGGIDFDYAWTIKGVGWDSSLVKSDPNYRLIKPNKTIYLKMKGRNGYAGTAIMFVQSAVSILHDRPQIPYKGGVYTPGIIFADTNLAERLNSRGFTFELEKSQ